MILVLSTHHIGAHLEDDVVICPIELDDDAFLLSTTLPSISTSTSTVPTCLILLANAGAYSLALPSLSEG